MKIALFSDTYMPDINGVATSTRILHNELVKKGHEVMIVTSELPQDSDYVDDPSENILRVPGIEIQRLYGYRAANIFSYKGMKELKQFGVQVIHCQTEFGVGVFSRLAAEVLDVPIVYTYHTMWADYSHYLLPIKSNAVDGILKKMIYRFSKLCGSRCTELIVPSSKTSEALEEYGIHKTMHIIPTGLELDKFDPKNSDPQIIEQLKREYALEDKFVITFLGRIAKEKSIDMIIDATKIIAKSRNDFKVMIVGGGPSLEELKEKVSKDGLEEFVVFTGPKPPKLVPSHYHLSNVFASASLSETQGLTFIEAMASGIPALARRDKNLEDVIIDGRNGYFFEDEDDLAKIVLGLMESDTSVLNQQAYQDAMQYSSDIFGQKVLDVYKLAQQNKEYLYTIKDIHPSKNQYYDVVVKSEASEIVVEVSNRVIENLMLSIGDTVDREVYDRLIEEEKVASAYQRALKYLSYKDYSAGQLRKKLVYLEDYDDCQLDKTMELLKEKNLINDEAFTMHYLRRAIRLEMGLNKAVYNLINLDIPRDVIDRCILELEDDEEYQAALCAIESVVSKSKSVSFRATLKKSRDKLYLGGFRSDTIERALQDYDFHFDQEEEIAALNKDYDKLFTKYRRKVNNKELMNKVVDSLLKKGYNYEDIKIVIEEREDQRSE